MTSKHFLGYLPITEGNKLAVYLDGAAYCNALYQELQKAKQFVFLTGLHFMGDFRLNRTAVASDLMKLSQVLIDTAKRGVTVYLLVNQFWKDEAELSVTGNPVKGFIARTGELHGYLPETFRLFEALSSSSNVHCRTDIHPHPIFGTHHQKTVVIDDRIAFLGGIDLTYLDGDRWDTDAHTSHERAVDRTQKFWHDIHMRVEGPAVEFVRDNFVQRWTNGDLHTLRASHRKKPLVAWMVVQNGGVWVDAVADKNPPALPPFPVKLPPDYRYPKEEEFLDRPFVQIVRSYPRPNLNRGRPVWYARNDSWERSCKEAYIKGIDLASQYIYLENQWVADEDIWAALVCAARRNKSNPDFRIVIVVPYQGLFAAGLGANQELWINEEIYDVFNALGDEERFTMYGLMQTDRSYDSSRDLHAQIYVHSKILIVDDTWALIGSANAGGISLEGVRTGADQPDTELSAIILDRKFVSDFRRRLWEEHLKEPSYTVSTSYQARDADRFRLWAANGHKRLRFYDVYSEVLFMRNAIRKTPWGKLTLAPIRSESKIVSSFPKHLEDGLPPTLLPAGFRAHILPSVPPGYRAWYQWSCDILGAGGQQSSKVKKGFAMQPLMNRDRAPATYAGYWDQDAAYISPDTAKAIDRHVTNITDAQIRCDVQLLELDQRPTAKKAPDVQLRWPCKLVNEKFAKANLPHFGGTASVAVS